MRNTTDTPSVCVDVGTQPTRPIKTKHQQNTEAAQWFQLVGESIVCAGSTLFLVDAIQNNNVVYASGSICCQLGSVLMIAQSVWVIASAYRNT